MYKDMYTNLKGTDLKYKFQKETGWQELWLHKYNQEPGHDSNQIYIYIWKTSQKNTWTYPS